MLTFLKRGTLLVVFALLAQACSGAPVFPEHASVAQPTVHWAIDMSSLAEVGEAADVPSLPDAMLPLMEGQIKNTLIHPQGWRNGGIDFQYTEGEGGAEIVFRPHLLPENVQAACGVDLEEQTAVACYEFVSGGLDEEELTCVVHLQANPLGLDFQMVVNHEVGHCLGFGHAETGLMSAANPISNYPWPEQSKLLREYVVSLNTSR